MSKKKTKRKRRATRLKALKKTKWSWTANLNKERIESFKSFFKELTVYRHAKIEESDDGKIEVIYSNEDWANLFRSSLKDGLLQSKGWDQYFQEV